MTNGVRILPSSNMINGAMRILPSSNTPNLPPFDPTQIPGLVLFLESDVDVTVDAGRVTGIPAWLDQSPAHNDFDKYGTKTSFLPFYNTDQINGFPDVEGHGGQRMVTQVNIPAGEGPYTLFQVAKVLADPDSGMGATLQFRLSDGTPARKQHAILSGHSGNQILIANDGNSSNFIDYVPGVYNQFLAWHYRSQIWEGGGTPIGGIWLNGVSYDITGADALATPNSDTISTTLLLYTGFNFTYPSNIAVAAIILYDSILSDSNRIKVETYLKNRYAL